MKIFICFGVSMLPTIQQEESVAVYPVPYDQIELGDVVAFKTRDGFILHRLHQEVSFKKEKVWITKGDGNKEDDFRKYRYLSHRNYLGRAEYSFHPLVKDENGRVLIKIIKNNNRQ